MITRIFIINSLILLLFASICQVESSRRWIRRRHTSTDLSSSDDDTSNRIETSTTTSNVIITAVTFRQSFVDSCGASFISNCSRPTFSIANFSGLHEFEQMRSFAESSSLIKPMLVQAANEAKLRVDRMRARTETDLDDNRSFLVKTFVSEPQGLGGPPNLENRKITAREDQGKCGKTRSRSMLKDWGATYKILLQSHHDPQSATEFEYKLIDFVSISEHRLNPSEMMWSSHMRTESFAKDGIYPALIALGSAKNLQRFFF